MSLKKAQSLIEFTTIATIVILICVAALYFFGDSLKDIFNTTRVQTIFDRDSSRTQF